MLSKLFFNDYVRIAAPKELTCRKKVKSIQTNQFTAHRKWA